MLGAQAPLRRTKYFDTIIYCIIQYRIKGLESTLWELIYNACIFELFSLFSCMLSLDYSFHWCSFCTHKLLWIQLLGIKCQRSMITVFHVDRLWFIVLQTCFDGPCGNSCNASAAMHRTQNSLMSSFEPVLFQVQNYSWNSENQIWMKCVKYVLIILGHTLFPSFAASYCILWWEKFLKGSKTSNYLSFESQLFLVTPIINLKELQCPSVLRKKSLVYPYLFLHFWWHYSFSREFNTSYQFEPVNLLRL